MLKYLRKMFSKLYNVKVTEASSNKTTSPSEPLQNDSYEDVKKDYRKDPSISARFIPYQDGSDS